MANIRPTGTDIITGQAREVEDADDLIVSNVSGPSDLTINAAADTRIDAGSGGTLKLGNITTDQAITIGGGFDAPDVGSIWIEPTPGIADGQQIVIQGAFADDTQGFNGGTVSIFGGPSEAGAVNAGNVYITGGDASASASGGGGNVEISPGSGPSGDGIIILYGASGGSWEIKTDPTGSGGSSWLMGNDDPSTGAIALITGQQATGALGGDLRVQGGNGDGGEGGHLFLVGGRGEGSDQAGDVYILGGLSAGTFNNGGYVWIDAADSQAEGGEGGRVMIGTNQGVELTGNTRRVIIGDENSTIEFNEVQIFNCNLGSPTSRTTVSGGLVAGDALAEAGLIKVQPGGTTIGGLVGPPITLGPVYYNPQTGDYIRMGNSVYIDGNGINNLIRAGDGDDLDTIYPYEATTSGDTYSLASAGVIAASALEPGTVTVRIIIDGDSNFSEVTDDGAGNFASGAVLPSGGTVNYAARTLTGTTAGLTFDSRVEISFAIADAAGEELTVRAGNGAGSGDGADLYLASGTGVVPGNLSLRAAAQGSSSVVDRYLVNAVSKALTNTTPTSIFTAAVSSNTMVGGSVSLTVRANDASDYQATTVMFTYAAINDAGTVTSQVTLNSSNTATIASTGTLTVAASAVNGAGIITIQITATSSLTPTTLDATYQVINNSGQAITIV